MSNEICKFKYCKTLDGFTKTTFTGSELVFIEQTGQIWTHGNYFGADLSKLVTIDKLNTTLESYVTQDSLGQQFTERLAGYQPKGDYLVEGDLSNYYSKSEVEGKLSAKADTDHDHVVSDITNLNQHLASLGYKKIEIVSSLPANPDSETIYMVV